MLWLPQRIEQFFPGGTIFTPWFRFQLFIIFMASNGMLCATTTTSPGKVRRPPASPGWSCGTPSSPSSPSARRGKCTVLGSRCRHSARGIMGSGAFWSQKVSGVGWIWDRPGWLHCGKGRSWYPSAYPNPEWFPCLGHPRSRIKSATVFLCSTRPTLLIRGEPQTFARSRSVWPGALCSRVADGWFGGLLWPEISSQEIDPWHPMGAKHHAKTQPPLTKDGYVNDKWCVISD